MYIYTIKDSKAILISNQESYDRIITQETYPACIDYPNTRAVLSYNETEGVHWEYIPLTPKELRERAYETEKCITYDGETLTVDEANKLWQEYQAEGNEKADKLTTMISAAKADIRNQYPDTAE
jgi:hypothetical protein